MCAGQFLMIKPLVKHSLSSISTDFLKLTAAFTVPEGNPLAEALNNERFVCAHMTPQLMASAEFLFEEASRPTEYTSRMITGRACEMLYSIVKHKLHTVDTNIPDPNADERVVRAKKYIDDNVSDFLDTGDVADYCNLSIKQLNRLFTANEGMTVLRYIHLSKIARAKELLADGELSIREISAALGFQNEYYFNTFFSRVSGMTPGDFRRSISVPQ